jgi:hypothetical protein
MAVVQLRHRDSEGRAYYDPQSRRRENTDGSDALAQCRLSDIVYHQMVLDRRTITRRKRPLLTRRGAMTSETGSAMPSGALLL